jgi:hypothetical protein
MRPVDNYDKDRRTRLMADVVRLRREGVEFADIGVIIARDYRDEAPDQPYTKQYMHEMWNRALLEVPATEVRAHRKQQLELTEELLREGLAILRRDHVAVSQGHVVRIGRPVVNEDGKAEIREGEGEPVLDDGPKVAAINALTTVLTRIAKITGSDTAVKQEVEHTGTMNYRINGVDMEKMK